MWIKIGREITKVIKLKELVSESTWKDRKFGEPLPTVMDYVKEADEDSGVSDDSKLKELSERRGDVQKYSYKVIEPIRRDWEKKFRDMNRNWMKKNMDKIEKYASKEHGRDISLSGKGKEDFQKVYNNWQKACNDFELWLDQLQSIGLED